MTRFLLAAAFCMLAGGGCAGKTLEQRADDHQRRAEELADMHDSRGAATEQEKADRLRLKASMQRSRASGYGRDDTQYVPGYTPPTIRPPLGGLIDPYGTP